MLIVVICKDLKVNLEADDFDLPRRLVILIGLESDEVNGDLDKVANIVQNIKSIIL